MKHSFVIAALLLAAGSAAQAQGYFGVSAGVTHANLDCTGTLSCDNTGSGGKVFGGYRLPFGLGIEGLYHDYGKATATVPVGGSSVLASLRSTGVGAGVSYLLPFGPTAWSATFRLGLASNKSKASVSGSGGSGSLEETNTGAYTGAQVSWHPNKNLSVDITADFSRFEQLGERYNTRMLGAGVTFSF